MELTAGAEVAEEGERDVMVGEEENDEAGAGGDGLHAGLCMSLGGLPLDERCELLASQWFCCETLSIFAIKDDNMSVIFLSLAAAF